MVGLPRKPDPRPSLLALDRQLTILDFNTHGILHQCSLTINECKFSPSLPKTLGRTWQLTSAILNIREDSQMSLLYQCALYKHPIDVHVVHVGLSREWDPRLAHSCTRFPCYLGMEIYAINAETQ